MRKLECLETAVRDKPVGTTAVKADKEGVADSDSLADDSAEAAVAVASMYHWRMAVESAGRFDLPGTAALELDQSSQNSAAAE